MDNTETWYVLDDGAVASPNDVVRGEDGMLRHSDGRAIARRPEGGVYMTRSVDAEAERQTAKAAAKAAREKAKADADADAGKPAAAAKARAETADAAEKPSGGETAAQGDDYKNRQMRTDK